MTFVKLRNTTDTDEILYITFNDETKNYQLNPLEEKIFPLLITGRDGRVREYDGGTVFISVFVGGQHLWEGYVPTNNESPILIDPELGCVTHNNVTMKDSYLTQNSKECSCKKT